MINLTILPLPRVIVKFQETLIWASWHTMQIDQDNIKINQALIPLLEPKKGLETYFIGYF